MTNKTLVYSEFNSYLFEKLLESRSKLSKSIKYDWQHDRSENLRHLSYIIARENEIMEEIWNEWQKESYEK